MAPMYAPAHTRATCLPFPPRHPATSDFSRKNERQPANTATNITAGDTTHDSEKRHARQAGLCLQTDRLTHLHPATVSSRYQPMLYPKSMPTTIMASFMETRTPRTAAGDISPMYAGACVFCRSEGEVGRHAS